MEVATLMLKNNTNPIMEVATLTLKNNTNEMEGLKYKMQMTTLVGEINRMNEENQMLNAMLKRMKSNYNDLQRHIRSVTDKKQKPMRLDRSEICNPDDQSEENFNLRTLSQGSVHADSSGTVSHDSYNSPDCHEQVREKEGKKAKFMDDQQLPSKKRKINSIQLDHTQNDIIVNSFMAESLICDKSPDKKHKSLSKRSSEQTVAGPKRIVSVRTRNEGSQISDGCQWRKYGQKMTRNNTRPRSYYKCAMAPSCPVKKQVQRCTEDPTIVVTSYEGEHTHYLSPLAMAVMHAGLSNQIIDEGLNTENCSADNHFMPFSTARICTSSPFPTITLDLTDNQPNPGLQVKQPSLDLNLPLSDLAVGRSQHLTPLPNNIGRVFKHLSIMDSVASMKADPNFTAALAAAIADSMLKSGALIQGMHGYPPATQYTDGSTPESCA